MKLTEKHCKPCEGGVPPLTDDEENTLMNDLDGWDIERKGVHRIYKTWLLPTFVKAIEFVNEIARLAEEEGHHPELIINYRRVTVELSTHAILGLSENDFILASKINQLKINDHPSKRKR
ncbi:MAG: 4a-hydroxytetrahydrobiopterin dehydratase [Chitinispirillaceae bacterium]|nr:4a-hydroxytetrahydrobiopterin dehydratase [Chitinispirillaceae bacterium]